MASQVKKYNLNPSLWKEGTPVVKQPGETQGAANKRGIAEWRSNFRKTIGDQEQARANARATQGFSSSLKPAIPKPPAGNRRKQNLQGAWATARDATAWDAARDDKAKAAQQPAGQAPNAEGYFGGQVTTTPQQQYGGIVRGSAQDQALRSQDEAFYPTKTQNRGMGGIAQVPVRPDALSPVDKAKGEGLSADAYRMMHGYTKPGRSGPIVVPPNPQAAQGIIAATAASAGQPTAQSPAAGAPPVPGQPAPAGQAVPPDTLDAYAAEAAAQPGVTGMRGLGDQARMVSPGFQQDSEGNQQGIVGVRPSSTQNSLGITGEAFNRDASGQLGGGSFSVATGPRGGISDADWNKMTQEQRTAVRVGLLDQQRAAIHDLRAARWENPGNFERWRQDGSASAGPAGGGYTGPGGSWQDAATQARAAQWKAENAIANLPRRDRGRAWADYTRSQNELEASNNRAAAEMEKAGITAAANQQGKVLEYGLKDQNAAMESQRQAYRDDRNKRLQSMLDERANMSKADRDKLNARGKDVYAAIDKAFDVKNAAIGDEDANTLIMRNALASGLAEDLMKADTANIIGVGALKAAVLGAAAKLKPDGSNLEQIKQEIMARFGFAAAPTAAPPI
jgi:hypothetical protein